MSTRRSVSPPERYRDRDEERSSSRRVRDDGRRREDRRRALDRSRSPERSRDSERRSDSDRHRRRRSRSRSESGTDSDSDTSDSDVSEDSDARRRRRRRDKEKRRDKEDRKRRKEKKEKKKRKKEKKAAAAKTASSTAQWGKYGIITENDISSKDQEFRAWLVEERMINPETVSKDKTRKEFMTFVEDYNTATLPHEKYYDMPKYEMKMDMIRSGTSFEVANEGAYDPMADIRAHKSALRKPKGESDTFLSKEQLQDLRRIQNERIEVGRRKVMGLEVPKNLGVRQEDREVASFD